MVNSVCFSLYAKISNFNGKFQLFDLKIEKYHIFCNILEMMNALLERSSNFGLEMPFCESRFIALLELLMEETGIWHVCMYVSIP